jgi:DNA-binding helix-hairpin-helix protein with protein kinase domain
VAAKNLAAAFHNLYAHGIVIGDVNEQNIKVRNLMSSISPAL